MKIKADGSLKIKGLDAKGRKLLKDKFISSFSSKEILTLGPQYGGLATENELNELKVFRNNDLGLKKWANFKTFEGGELNFVTHCINRRLQRNAHLF